MSWYSHMFKSQEVARKLNRQEQRRSDENRYGPQFVAQYQLANLEKERRLIEKELERIRKGVHKQPKYEETKKTGKGTHVLDVSWQKGRLFNEDADELTQTITPEYSKDEQELYDAIVFLQNNPSALVPILTAHAQSDAYLETLERISPRLNTEHSSTFVPRYLKEHASREEKTVLLHKYTELLHKHNRHQRKNSPVRQNTGSPARKCSPVRKSSPVRKGSPARKNSPQPGQYRSSPVYLTESPLVHSESPRHQNGLTAVGQDSNRCSPLVEQTIDTVPPTEDSGESSEPLERPTPNQSPSPSLPKSRRQQLDIVTLATDGMQKARVNAARRLGPKAGTTHVQSTIPNQQQQKQEIEEQKQTDEHVTTDATEEGETISSANIAADIMNARKTSRAVAMFPTFDPDVYNADGTLRTVHNMPTFESAWEEAQKARYVRRPNEALERDRELSVNEIFDKS